jgi:hypothetical protein
MAESELNYVPNPVLRIEGVLTPGEAASAIVAGQNAPQRLSFDPNHPDYDARWCRMLRDVQLNGEPIDDVIGFDMARQVIFQLVRDDKNRHEFEYLGPAGGGPGTPGARLTYKCRELQGHVTVQYGLPVEPSLSH